MRVIFDSNVWRPVVSPNVFPNDPDIKSFVIINEAIREGKVVAWLSETMFTLEAIKKDGRKTFLSSYRPKTKMSVTTLPTGGIKVSHIQSPDDNAHPGNNNFLAKHLNDAEILRFRILRVPRFGMPSNPDVKMELLVNITNEINDRLSACGREIEAYGCGISHIKQIGAKYAPKGKSWHAGVAIAPVTEDKAIIKAFAEWADGDTVTAHYGYNSDYICTRDAAKAAGSTSVFSSKNLKWLRNKYSVNVITPKDLAALIV